MKINHVRILTDVLDKNSILHMMGPHITRLDNKFVLFRQIHDAVEVLAEHEDWSKFLWLCGEWYKQQKES